MLPSMSLEWIIVIYHAKFQPFPMVSSYFSSKNQCVVGHFIEKNDFSAEMSLSVGLILLKTKKAYRSLKVETFSRPEKV